MTNTFFVSGYSFKGGVGRSTALANIACLLAEDDRHSQKILIWDFDLEAPGMHRMFPSRGPLPRGFVDLAYQYASTDTLPDVADFVYESEVAGVHVLPAGVVDESYCSTLNRINWMSFFDNDPTSQGRFFGELCEWMKEIGEYDYVFIDSRTGVSDVAGICTQVLPDVLLMFFRLNEQNIDGVSHLVPTIEKHIAMRQRKVRILPIVSPVLPHSSDRFMRLRDEVNDVFPNRKLQHIRFDQDLVSDEKLFCLNRIRSEFWPEPVVIKDYSDVARAIRALNKFDTFSQEKKLNRSIQNEDFASMRRVLPNLILRRPDTKSYWKTLRTVCQRTELEFGDAIVKQLEDRGVSNVNIDLWQASTLVQNAIDSDSKELLQAKERLEKALDASPDKGRSGILKMQAELASCVGDLKLSTQKLEECIRIEHHNSQLKVDLAMEYVRQGRDFFMLARNHLEGHSKRLQTPILVYLLSFFGEDVEAGRCFEELSETISDWTQPGYLRLVKAHSLTLLGDFDAARKIANAALAESPDDYLNWAECLICMGRERDGISLLEQGERETDGDTHGLKKLAEYLTGDISETSEVMDAWKSRSWSFTELLFFAERTKRDGLVNDRLGVVEQLIRMTKLRSSSGNEESLFWRRGKGKRGIALDGLIVRKMVKRR
ncbi:KGGVGR-motif variant AAA ATPase [Planctomycetota bacterium]